MIANFLKRSLMGWLMALPACSNHALLALGTTDAGSDGFYSAKDALRALRPLEPDGHVVLESAFELDFSDHFTLEVWIFPHSSRGGVLFCKVGRAENKRLTLSEGSLAVSASLQLAATPEPQILQTTSVLQPKQWHHLALNYDRSDLALFVDGIPAARVQATHPVVDESTPAYFGACLPDDPLIPAADVSLSDLRFSRVGRYTDAFTPEPQLEADPDASALFRLDEGSGGPLTDSSAHALTGSAIAPVQWTSLPPR